MVAALTNHWNYLSFTFLSFVAVVSIIVILTTMSSHFHIFNSFHVSRLYKATCPVSVEPSNYNPGPFPFSKYAANYRRGGEDVDFNMADENAR